MIAVPELVCLLEQLLVCALVVLVVQFEGLDKVSMNHFGLRVDRFNHIIEASFNINQCGTHCIYYVDVTFTWMRSVLHEVFLKLLIS